MNLSESLSKLKNLIDRLESPEPILEAAGHLDHVEDLIFLGGSDGALRGLKAAMDTVKNPKTVTIKWDGYPALIFGRGEDGRFTIMDKHMFNKKDGTGRLVFSPQEFVKYDQDRGVERTQLASLMSELWPGLDKASAGSTGYYWGDLLFSSPLEPHNGKYRFKANPNGITYEVDANSELGKLMTNKIAGIAVHQFIPAGSPNTDSAVTLNGTIGDLKNNSNVAIVPSAMPSPPKLSLDKALVQNAKNAISKYGSAVDQLMDTAPQARNTFNQLFTVYINKRIVAGSLDNLVDGFMDFVESRPLSDKMKAKIIEHLQQNSQGVIGAFTIWIALYNLKMNVVQQLNKAAESSPVQGYLDDGTNTQEGFVSNGLKFIDRMGFSRQNLAGRR